MKVKFNFKRAIQMFTVSFVFSSIASSISYLKLKQTTDIEQALQHLNNNYRILFYLCIVTSVIISIDIIPKEKKDEEVNTTNDDDSIDGWDRPGAS